MATASIGGLGSGLDTAGIVSQLMQLEALPRTQLKNRVSSEETTVKALQSLNSRVAALATKAADLGKPEAWNALTATSSMEGVSVTATSSATVAELDVKVLAVASRHGETYTQTAAADDVLVPVDADSGKRLLTVTHANGTTATIDTGDGTLRGVVDGLNETANSSGVRATMLQVSPGDFRLVVDSEATGANSSFSLSVGGADLLGGPEAARTRQATDAQIEVSGFTLTSSTNTFDDLLPGVSVTLSTKAKVGETAEITVNRDPETQAKAVKSLVDEINSLLTEIDTRSAYDATTKTSGILGGDSTVRTLRSALVSALYPADGTSMAGVGLQTDRYGKLVFDEETFNAAYTADPAKVAAAFGTENGGFAARVKNVADQTSDKYTGTLTSAIQSRNDGISRLNDSIAAWDLRLELRQTTLTRQFTALDVALGRMNSQSSWLAGQIASLSSSSSNN